MNKLKVIIDNLGHTFIKYILNIDSQKTSMGNLSLTPTCDIKLSSTQIFYLEKIYTLVQNERKHNFENDFQTNSMHCTLKYLINEKNYYAQKIRRNCGGELYSHKKTGDDIIDFLGIKISKCYPKLLIPQNNFQMIDFSNEERNYLKKIIEKDVLNNLVVINKNNDKRIGFSLIKRNQEEISIECVCDILNMFLDIIIKSFNNCEYRLDFSLPKVFKEIKLAINMLRRIAERKNIDYSRFTGLKGLVFDGFKEINLSNIIVRHIEKSEFKEKNIGLTTIITANRPKNNISGVIIETKHRLKFKKILKNTEYNCYENNHDIFSENEEDRRISDFNLAILFTLNKLDNVTISFKDTGFWIGRSKYVYDHQNYSKTFIINKEDVSEVKKWYNLLQNSPVIISETIINIKNALLNSKDETDSIMNGFYAWEGMFTSKSDTSNSVIKSLALYTGKSEKRINELYDKFRSHKSHGKAFKKDNKVNSFEIKNEVLDIAITSLKRLLQDSELIDLKPSKRVKKLEI